MDFSDNFTHVTKITGNHIKEHSNEDVKIVWFYHDFCPSFMLKNIPKGLSNFFQNMQVLFFGSCPIDNLNGDELEEYSNLETFINIYSKIKKVPGSFFKNNQKLKHIQFNNNQIEKIGTKLFDGVENLESIWFEENICVNNSAQSKVEVLRLIQDLKEKCPDETDEIGRTEQNEELETTTGLEGYGPATTTEEEFIISPTTRIASIYEMTHHEIPQTTQEIFLEELPRNEKSSTTGSNEFYSNSPTKVDKIHQKISTTPLTPLEQDSKYYEKLLSAYKELFAVLIKQIAKLHVKIKDLKEENQKLENEIKEYKKSNEELKGKLEAVKEKFNQYSNF